MSPPSNPNAKPLSLPAMMLSAGLAASWAEVCTIPIDTAKVRLQMQGNVAAGVAPKYNGMIGTLSTIVKEEGPLSPWKGLSPGLQRQMVFASLRIGLYEPVRNLFCGKDFKGDPPLLMKIAAGITTGAIGILVASPTDLVKVRLQSEGRLPLGAVRRYNGSLDAYKKIIRDEGGVKALWTGIGPNVLRNCIINAAELASYDQIKQTILQNQLLPDNLACHFTSALGAGFIATVCGSPVDVVKTRVMSANTAKGEVPKYSGALDCIVKTFKNEGVGAFYKGFIPNFARIGSWNIVMFVTVEQIRAYMRQM